jgi:hypothetical protein
MNQKTKWLVWAIVFLFLINAVTLGTIFYQSYKQQHQVDSTSITGTFSGNVINGRFFRKTLGFNNEQMAAFQKAHQQFRPQTMALTLGIDNLKAEMFAEMKNQQPDTLKLSKLSKEIGDMHGQLKLKTFQFYLKLKAVCSDQQKTQLEKIFEPLFINENILMAPHGFQRGLNRANN